VKAKFFRISLLTAGAAALAVIFLGLGAAWVYTYALTHPGCNEPSPVPGLAEPRTIWFDSSDSVRVRAWYYPPKNGAAIVVLGGMDGALGVRYPRVDFLARAGYGLLQIDTRACSPQPAVVTLGAKEALDAATGVAYLRLQPEVRKVGIFGFSMGAAAALQAASQHPEIAAVVAEGGYFNLGDDMIEAGRPVNPLHRGFLYAIAAAYRLHTGADPWESSPIDALPTISPRPVLLIYGEAEEESGRAQDQFLAAKEPKELWIVPGGSHGRNYSTNPQAYEQRVLEFFESWLR
jgi:dipeptidyl aminopeptidase/acylaminoacyl peptidase